MPNFGIIGGGISGLSHAWQLKQAGHSVTLFEASDACGGPMASYRTDGYLAEEGPHSILLNKKSVADFIHSIPGLSNSILPAEPSAKKRFILRDGKIVTVPMSPLQALTTPLFSAKAKLRLLKEPFIKKGTSPEESVADFVRRRLGPEVEQYAVNPFVGGIYAGDPEQLSVQAAFPKLAQLEAEHGSLIRGVFKSKKDSSDKIPRQIISFQNGIAQLPQALSSALSDTIHCSTHITKITKQADRWEVEWTQNGESHQADFDQLMLALPGHRVAELPFDTELQSQLTPFDTITYPPVSVLTMGFARSAVAHPLDGFGLLMPACEKRQVLGALFPATLFPNRAPKNHVLVTAFVGGTRQSELATADTEQVLATALKDLGPLLGFSAEPSFVHHKHWAKAIPQYKMGYKQYTDLAKSLSQSHPGLHLTGNYLNGISVTQCIESAIAFAK